MGSQTPSGNDRSRTYWTPAMERYFIDLMLEQMHRGNRIGHTFTKQAWTDMLSMFNVKFGSQYDKDVLKSRYTNLWKQFNDIKNLLGSGFSWDETRQMVIADDCTWDAYIKLHPDARSYKTKAVLNFNDLYLIYGYTSADGRYSRSSHDIDFDDEVQGVNIGDAMGILTSLSNDRSRTDWTPAMDQYFIELMLDQIGRGNQTENTFNKQAWTDMLALFNAKFGPQHGKRVLRHRYKKLWKYHTDITTIVKQDGFFWDETQQLITADDDAWDSYIKAHPHARTYRTKTLPNYSDLVLIYGDVTGDRVSSHICQDKDLEDDISITKTGEGKGSQPSAGSDRTRTFWTPPMDRYLIDLLLDQVHRGNKLGQTFITQAWIDMVTSFNANFHSHHDKDVLKNRYKHLKRQYNDIKILLDQSGFSWDETREMVMAEDFVWDAYTKAHPDARSYRVKTVPSYQKLCVVFGEENFVGRYNRLARNVETNGEITVLMTGEKNDEILTSTEPLRIDWNPPMDQYFIDLMLVHVHGGNKSDYTFNNQAWAHMIESFNDKFGLHCNKHDLEDRYNCLMKQQTDIRILLDHSGFTWDETKQMVNANNDVWEAYIKDHQDAISYKDKILESYSDMCEICGNRGSIERLSSESQGMEIDHKAREIDLLDGVPGNLQSLVVDTGCCDQKRKQPSTTPDSGSCTKMQKTGKENNEAIFGMQGIFRKMVKDDKNNDSIGTAIDALQCIPDIDDELLLDACDLLEDERKAKTFLALDATLRKKWLLRKLRK